MKPELENSYLSSLKPIQYLSDLIGLNWKYRQQQATVTLHTIMVVVKAVVTAQNTPIYS